MQQWASLFGLVSLLASHCFAACPPPLAERLEGIQCAALQTEGCRALCVINTFNTGSYWFIFSEQTWPIALEFPPNSMSLVSEFSLSPDQTWIAALSSGEGHPFIDVTPLAPFIANIKRANAQYSLNPYPEGISLSRWQTDETGHSTQLCFNSNHWFPHGTDLITRVAEFCLDLNSGEIQPSTNLAAPLPYYIDILQHSSELWERRAALAALVQLRLVGTEQALRKLSLPAELLPDLTAALARLHSPVAE